MAETLDDTSGNTSQGTADNAVIVRDNPAARRYEISVGGKVLGFSVYYPDGDQFVFVHTEIEPSEAGRGFGSQLIGAALDDVRARHLTVVPLCTFVAAYIRDHPEYASLVAADGHSRTVLRDPQ